MLSTTACTALEAEAGRLTYERDISGPRGCKKTVKNPPPRFNGMFIKSL